MRRAGWAAIAGVAMLVGATPPPAQRVVSGDAMVPVTVNGRSLRLRIEPSVPGLPIVAPALAPALGLRTAGFFGISVGYHIGRETTYGATQVVGFALDGGKPGKRRVGWMSRPYSPWRTARSGRRGCPIRWSASRSTRRAPARRRWRCRWRGAPGCSATGS